MTMLVFKKRVAILVIDTSFMLSFLLFLPALIVKFMFLEEIMEKNVRLAQNDMKVFYSGIFFHYETQLYYKSYA